MFSLQATPEASRPGLFSDLLTLDCDSILCSTWRVKSTASAPREIDQQEKFISLFKVGVLTRVMSGRDTASLDKGAGAKAATMRWTTSVKSSAPWIRRRRVSIRFGCFLRGQPAELRDAVTTVHRVFVDARAQVEEETLGNLSAFYAMFPGNQKFSVFPV